MDTQKEIAIWKGSSYTASDIARQIVTRWGELEVKNYHPLENCFTFKTWLAKGYRVKKGEKALRTITFKPIETKTKDGKTKEKSIPSTVCLFYHLQVEKINE